MTQAEVIQVSLAAVNVAILVVLVVVTWKYARSTRRIAEAAREQAQASVEMAEEMREQRWSALRPVIVPELTPSHGEVHAKSVTCRNLGAGPGLDVALTVFDASAAELWREWDAASFPGGSIIHSRNLPVLKPEGETSRTEQDWSPEDHQWHKGWTLCIVVECLDVYERIWRSGLELWMTQDDKGRWQFQSRETIVSDRPVKCRVRSYP